MEVPLFLMPLIASSEVFNIRAHIQGPKPSLNDIEDSARQKKSEILACLNGIARQFKFDGENWRLQNWVDNAPPPLPNSKSITCRGSFDLIQVTDEMLGLVSTLQNNKDSDSNGPTAKQKIRAWIEFIQFQPPIQILCSVTASTGAVQPICSGTSACLTDECQCDGGPVLYCPGKLGGCIPFSQVCDGALCSQGWEWSCNVCRCEQLPPLT